MARVTGGVTGRPAGKLAGIVFGAARGRAGKLVTAREKVKPANPDTDGQKTQRNKFRDALQAVRFLGPAAYKLYWNRAVGQLPGFQSLSSVLLNNVSDVGAFETPPDVPLGPNHFPATFAVTTGGDSGKLESNWSDESGPGSDPDDVYKAIAIPVARAHRSSTTTLFVDSSAKRSDESADLVGLRPSTPYLIGSWFVGAGDDNLGQLSLCRFSTATSSGA